MSNGFTITNAPPPPEPSQISEVTALVAAIGTAFGGIAVPLVALVALLIFRKPLSELIRKVSSFEAPGGIKAQMQERLAAKTDAVETMAAEEMAALPTVATQAPETRVEVTENSLPPDSVEAPTVSPNSAAHGHQSTEPPNRSSVTFDEMLDRVRALNGPSDWYFDALPSDGYVDKRTFEDLLLSHPASAVLFVWNEVETDLRMLAQRRKIYPKHSRIPARVLIDKLSRIGAMPPELASLLYEMLDVRADALHSGGQITERVALDYRRSAMVAGREIGRQISFSPPPDVAED